MRVGFPHFGNAYVAIRAMARRFGGDGDGLIIPPLMTQKTLDLGVTYSPSDACLPYKLTLGSLIEACELGADTLLQARGTGICRLGYYAKGQEQALRGLGYDVRFLNLDVSQHKIQSFVGLVRDILHDAPLPNVMSAVFFGLSKLFALDKIEKAVQKVRAVETEKGEANEIYRGAIKAIDEAECRKEVKAITEDHLDRLGRVPRDPTRDPIKVGVFGEIYVVVEPFANMDIEVELGKLGVEVHRTVTISRWVKYSLFLNYLGIDEWRTVHKLAKPYLDHDVGGDGWESVGEKILYARQGYDGVLHIAPFTCMPEIVAQNIMHSTLEDIPVFVLISDEQMAKQGMLTRLEAFVDLLEFRRRRGYGTAIHNSGQVPAK